MTNTLFVGAYTIIAILCFYIGILFGKQIEKAAIKNAGILHVETSDPDGPYLFVELSDPVEVIMNADTVSFTVDAKPYVAQ